MVPGGPTAAPATAGALPLPPPPRASTSPPPPPSSSTEPSAKPLSHGCVGVIESFGPTSSPASPPADAEVPAPCDDAPLPSTPGRLSSVVRRSLDAEAQLSPRISVPPGSIFDVLRPGPSLALWRSLSESPANIDARRRAITSAWVMSCCMPAHEPISLPACDSSMQRGVFTPRGLLTPRGVLTPAPGEADALACTPRSRCDGCGSVFAGCGNTEPRQPATSSDFETRSGLSTRGSSAACNRLSPSCDKDTSRCSPPYMETAMLP